MNFRVGEGVVLAISRALLRSRCGNGGVVMPIHDESEVRRFYERWSPSVYRYCHLLLGDAREAEESVAEAFLEFCRAGFKPEGEKLSLDLMRLAVAASEGRCSPPRDATDAQSFEACVRLLPCRERSVFLLRGTLSLSDAEVAEVTNIGLQDANRLWLQSLMNLRRLWLKRSSQGVL